MIILSRNECPYPPSPKIKLRVNECVDNLNRYDIPGMLSEFMGKLSNYAGFPENFLSPLPGSEAFFLYLSDFLKKKELSFTYSSPTFLPAVNDLRIRGIKVIDVPLTKDFKLNSESLRSQRGVLYIVNPSNPTGKEVANCDLVEDLLKHFTLIILDEAYFEFSGKTCVDLVKKHRNLLVLRTFSKAFCIAGARLGYVIGDPSTLKEVLLTRRSYDIPTLSIAAGSGALDDTNYMREVVDRILKTRDEFIRGVNSLPGWSAVDTETNFTLLKKEDISSAMLHELLRKKGYEVKPLTGKLNEYVRVSIGTEDEMLSLYRCLETLKLP